MKVLQEWQSSLERTLSFGPHNSPLRAGCATVAGIVSHRRDPGLSPGALCFISHNDSEQHGPQHYQLKGHEHHGLHEHYRGFLGKTSN